MDFQCLSTLYCVNRSSTCKLAIYTHVKGLYQVIMSFQVAAMMSTSILKVHKYLLMNKFYLDDKTVW